MMVRGARRTSPVWKMLPDKFAQVIAGSKTSTEALKHFRLGNVGGNNRTLWKRIKEEELDTSHFTTLQVWRHSRERWATPAIPLEEIMVKESTYSRGTLKARLLKAGILKNECAICGLGPIWNGKPIVMRLDHKNGARQDHREGNLRMVCPNCDSQLDTFCGRQSKQTKLRRCLDCSVRVSDKNGRRCPTCAGKKIRIGKWPGDQELIEQVGKYGNCATARQVGVSEAAVRKMVKRILADRLRVGQGALNT